MTSLYVKNVPSLERGVRILAATAAAVAAFAYLASPWSWLAASSAFGFALTGIVGYCPMCAMVGRKVDQGNL